MSRAENINNLIGIKLQSYFATFSLLKHKVEEEKRKKLGDSLSSGVSSSTSFAIEYLDDMAELDYNSNKTTISQMKNYASDFSINSEEIKNTLNNFYGNYLQFDGRQGIYFNFFSTSGIKSENATAIIIADEIVELRKNNINFLDILTSKDLPDYTNIVVNVIARILNIDPVSNRVNIIDFLSRITWYFNVTSLDDLIVQSLNLIKQIEWYGAGFKGKEDIFFDYLVQLFEKEALDAFPCYRSMLTATSLELAFYKFSNVGYKAMAQPADILTEERRLDFRSMEEKINDVCEITNKQRLDQYNISISRGKVDFEIANSDEKSAYQETIYEFCMEYLLQTFQKGNVFPSTMISIDEFLVDMCDYVEIKLTDRLKDYSYKFKSKDMICRTINILFDECYLDFKLRGEENGKR
ncbi:MAG: hypothetical protein WC152_04870 [Candidatus Izemoplasmatales bacterium]